MAIRNYMFDHPDQFWIDIIPSLQWRLNNIYLEPIDYSPHKYLFDFKISDFSDRLLNQNISETEEIRYMHEYIQRDTQLAIDIAAVITKHCYDSCHHQEEFAKGNEIWISQDDIYRP